MSPADSVRLSEAKQIAACYGIDVRAVAIISGGFSGACVLRAEDSDGRVWAIRKTAAQLAIPADRYCELVDLWQAMAASGFELMAVPRRHQQSPIRSLTGENSQSPENFDRSQTRLQKDDSVWQLEPWMSGRALQEKPTPTQIASTFQVLQSFHEVAAKASLKQHKESSLRVTNGPSPGVSRRLTIASELSNGQLEIFRKGSAEDPDREFRGHALRLCAAIQNWLPWLKSRLVEVADRSWPLQPVIRDLWRPHVLFTEDRVTGLIDLNAMSTDHVGLDVTRLLRSWFGFETEPIGHALTLFCQQRSFGSKEAQLLQAQDAATVLLSPVTWLRRRYDDAEKKPVHPEVMARFIELTNFAEDFTPVELRPTSASRSHHPR